MTDWKVCPRCRGEGSYCNPSIDGNGLSDDYAEDPDFMEEYLAGSYNVTCAMCHGRRVVPADGSAEEDYEHRNEEARIFQYESGIAPGHPDWRERI